MSSTAPIVDTPLVSIIMPAYNTVQFLKQAIESVEAQTYTNWELIIVDDGSTDGTAELATALAYGNIHVYKNESNKGIAFTRRRAVELSKGGLIAHLDSDDFIEPWALATLVAAFNKHPDVALAYSDFAQVSETGEVELYSKSNKFDADKLYQHGWRHFGVYRRSAYDSTAGFNLKLTHGCEDGDLFMQIAEKMPCLHVPKVLYFYRSRSNNTTRSIPKCEDCKIRPTGNCNYIRVWAKSAGYDPITYKPLTKGAA